MLSVAEAQAVVLHQARPLPPESVPLAPEALGLVLAEEITSDLDMPPYDKALMDGFAVRSADLPNGHPVVTVVPWFGSPDLRGLVPANAFVLLPEGDRQFRAGQTLAVLRVENDEP